MAASSRKRVQKSPIENKAVLNEAYDYADQVSFVRGMRVQMGPCTMLFISGTASVPDFAACCLTKSSGLHRPSDSESRDSNQNGTRSGQVALVLRQLEQPRIGVEVDPQSAYHATESSSREGEVRPSY